MAVYPAPEDGLADALKLSAAMTRKMAVCDVAMGGGKAVLAVPSLPAGEARVELLHRYGDFISSLGGLYATAPDMNTSERDMDTIAERTEHVFCRVGRATAAPAAPRRRPPSASSTASRPACGFTLGARPARRARARPGPRRRRLAARHAPRGRRRRGARLRRRPRARRRVRLRGRRPRGRDRHRVRRLRAVRARRDDHRRRPSSELRCRVVAGAANNQLADPALADRLHERGILYAPDYVINSGGVLHGTGLELLGWDRPQLDDGAARPRRHAARALRRQRPLAGPRGRGARRPPPRSLRSPRARGSARGRRRSCGGGRRTT